MKTTVETTLRKAYLGAGVYVECWHGMLKITTSNGERETNTIYFDENTITNLVGYVKLLETLKNQTQK